MSNTKDTKENNILRAYFWKCYNLSPFEHSLSCFKKRKMKIMTYRKKQIVKNNNAAPRCSLYRLRSKIQHYRISKGLIALLLEHRSLPIYTWPNPPPKTILLKLQILKNKFNAWASATTSEPYCNETDYRMVKE